MHDYPADDAVVAHIDELRLALPQWVVRTVALVELAENAERAGMQANTGTDESARALIVEVAEWQQKLAEWQGLALSPRLRSEMRILKATLDASMDEANTAARGLGLVD